MLLETLTPCGQPLPNHHQQNLLGKEDVLLRCHLQLHGCCHLKMPPVRGAQGGSPVMTALLMKHGWDEPAPAVMRFGFS